jgi:hypothetical protein
MLGGFRTQASRDECIRFVGQLAAAGAVLEAAPDAQGDLAAWFRAKTPAFEESIVDSVRLHEGIIIAGVTRSE